RALGRPRQLRADRGRRGVLGQPVEGRRLCGGVDRPPAGPRPGRGARAPPGLPRADRDPRARALPVHDPDDRGGHRVALAPQRDLRRGGRRAPAPPARPRAGRLARRGPHDGLAHLLPALLGRGGRGVRRLAWRAFVYAAAFGLAAQAVVPLLWMLSTSLKPPREVFATPPTFVPAAPTLENFARLVTDTAFLT